MPVLSENAVVDMAIPFQMKVLKKRKPILKSHRPYIILHIKLQFPMTNNLNKPNI
jgi:hypothetical protein